MSKQLTQDQFFDIYGKDMVQFDSYHKYQFKYTGTTESGYSIEVYYGQDSSDIYRHGVTRHEESVLSIYPFKGRVSRGDKTIHFFEE